MPSTYSSNLKLELMGTGDQSGTWGSTTNTNLGTLLEQAIVGYSTQAITNGADTVLTIANGASSTSRNYVLELTGVLTANRNLIVPAIQKPYIIYNNTSGGFAVTVKVSGQTGVTIANGKKAIVYNNGTDVIEVANAPVTETGTQTLTNKTLTSPTISGGSINNATIGNSTPSTGAFTTLSASSTVSGAGFSTYLASPPSIGGTTPAAGAFTTLSASSTVSGVGFSNYLASPPAIGGTTASTVRGTTITATTAFSGPLNGTVGATTPSTGAFTTLSASSTVSGAGFSTYLASPPAIGGTTPAAGSFTTLSASSTVSGAGFTSLFASPPAIGGTAAAAGAFTTLSASSTVSGVGFSNYLASPPAIGGTTASTIRGTTITATTAFSGPINGTVGATTPSTGAFTDLSATGTFTGSTGIMNIGSGQIYKTAGGLVGIGTSSPASQLDVIGEIRRTNGASYLSVNHDGVNGAITNSGGSLLLYSQSTNSVVLHTNSTERMRITASGGVAFGGSANYGSTGQSLVSNGNASPTWGSSIVSETAQASTSGGNIDFAIPAWAKRITILFRRVSSANNNEFIVQLGVAAGPVITGYTSTALLVTSGSETDFTATNGFAITSDNNSAYSYSGSIKICLVSGTAWVFDSMLRASTTTMMLSSGEVDIGGQLTFVRVTFFSSNTFDAGTINVLYE